MACDLRYVGGTLLTLILFCSFGSIRAPAGWSPGSSYPARRGRSGMVVQYVPEEEPTTARTVPTKSHAATHKCNRGGQGSSRLHLQSQRAVDPQRKREESRQEGDPPRRGTAAAPSFALRRRVNTPSGRLRAAGFYPLHLRTSHTGTTTHTSAIPRGPSTARKEHAPRPAALSYFRCVVAPCMRRAAGF